MAGKGNVMASKEALVTYGRRKRRNPDEVCDGDSSIGEASLDDKKASPPPSPSPSTPGLSRCRQYFLDFGQTDFVCSTCKTCGLVYARGHSEDERLHACFHKRYLQGTSFKGWQKERIVSTNEEDQGRVIVIMHSDPLQHQLKVKMIAMLMEKELGSELGWLLHNHCKVYMYIYMKKVIGCAVTESISHADHILSRKSLSDVAKLPIGTNISQIDIRQCLQPCATNVCSKSKMFSRPSSVKLSEKLTTQVENMSQECQRALYCGRRTTGHADAKPCSDRAEKLSHESSILERKTSGSAVCGIRGLWVTTSERRRGVATRLLDAVRSSFIYGLVLDESQVSYFHPTREGAAFAANYSKTDSYLVYS